MYHNMYNDTQMYFNLQFQNFLQMSLMATHFSAHFPLFSSSKCFLQAQEQHSRILPLVGEINIV